MNDDSFKEKSIDRFGKEHYYSRIDKGYFSSFSNRVTKEKYNREDENRDVVIFINNPHLFFEKIRQFFIKLGVGKDNIIISPVQYVNRQENSVSLVPYPHELLLKDNYYSNQSEIRIIINSNSDELIQYMNDNNNIIDIGDISDIVDIYDYYAIPYVLDPDGYGYAYVLENTMAGEEQHEDVMTSVIVSAEYAPPGFNLNESYLQYNSILVSESDALDYYWNRVPVPAELTGIVEAMRSASETIDRQNEWSTTYLLQIYDTYMYPSRGFRHQGLGYYFEGVCYYNIPIKHAGYSIDDHNRYYFGNYGVVRNNIYNIDINGINGPGSPEVGGKGYISAEISIMDWSTHEIIVDVGEEELPS